MKTPYNIVISHDDHLGGYVIKYGRNTDDLKYFTKSSSIWSDIVVYKTLKGAQRYADKQASFYKSFDVKVTTNAI